DGMPKDYSKAVQVLRPIAELDDSNIRSLFPASPEALEFPPAARHMLWLIYFRGGQGVQKDDAEAGRWCRMAAERGDAEAQRSLALLYRDGTGVAQDYSKAAEWGRRSAEQGDIVGQALLGEMYYVGQGVSQSYRESVKCFTAAAEQG